MTDRETIRVCFVKDIVLYGDTFDYIGEQVSDNSMEFEPDDWDIHSDIDNLFMFWEDHNTGNSIKDVEIHIPMEHLLCVSVVF